MSLPVALWSLDGKIPRVQTTELLRTFLHKGDLYMYESTDSRLDTRGVMSEGQRKVISAFIAFTSSGLIGWIGVGDLLKDNPELEFWSMAGCALVLFVALFCLRDHDALLTSIHDWFQAGVAALLAAAIILALILHLFFGMSVGAMKAFLHLGKRASTEQSAPSIPARQQSGTAVSPGNGSGTATPGPQTQPPINSEPSVPRKPKTPGSAPDLPDSHFKNQPPKR